MRRDWKYGRNTSPKTFRILPYGVAVERNKTTHWSVDGEIMFKSPSGWTFGDCGSGPYALYMDANCFDAEGKCSDQHLSIFLYNFRPYLVRP